MAAILFRPQYVYNDTTGRTHVPFIFWNWVFRCLASGKNEIKQMKG